MRKRGFWKGVGFWVLLSLEGLDLICGGTTSAYGAMGGRSAIQKVERGPKAERSTPPFGELILVPAGRFLMGSTEQEFQSAWEECTKRYPACEKSIFEAEFPEHLVYLKAYYIDRYNITNKQYKECVLDDECTPPKRTTAITDEKFDDYPVLFVDWYQAQNYCDWAGGRLPTEAEWEKAARGIEGFVYPWGDEMESAAAVWNRSAPEPVAKRVSGMSSFGAYDMAGNVWDWVADWFDPHYYETSPYYNPPGPEEGLHKVFRGGSWGSDLPVFLRSMTRNHNKPTTWNPYIGIRCAKDVSDGPSP